MLANTEVGSVITAAQSGAIRRWSFLIIPLLYTVQELAARLALGAARGYAELIHQNFARSMTFVSIAALSRFWHARHPNGWTGGCCESVRYPRVGVDRSTDCRHLMVGLGSPVRRANGHCVWPVRDGIFLLMAWEAHPDVAETRRWAARSAARKPRLSLSFGRQPRYQRDALGNFYQQSALVDKRLGIGHLKIARLDILIVRYFVRP